MRDLAFVILAHHQPAICRRLIRALAGPNTQIFLHVDARVDVQAFHVDAQGLHLLERRLPVNRGGWSLNRALMEGLRAAYAASHADVFVYLAGTDYPIKSSARIREAYAQRYPDSAVNFYPLLDGALGLDNFREYHFVDQLMQLAALIGRRTPGIDRATPFPELLSAMRRVLPARSFPAGWIPFRGSSRWCLSREAVRHLLELWDSPEGHRLRRYFRFTWGSDEMFVQTALFNSALAKTCVGYDADAVRAVVQGMVPRWQDELRVYDHYIDWDTTREDPAVLDLRDFERLASSPALFACKFLEERSDTLLDRLDCDVRQ